MDYNSLFLADLDDDSSELSQDGLRLITSDDGGDQDGAETRRQR